MFSFFYYLIMDPFLTRMNCHHLKENKKIMSDLHARDDDKRISVDSTEVDMINAYISHVAWCSYCYLNFMLSHNQNKWSFITWKKQKVNCKSSTWYVVVEMWWFTTWYFTTKTQIIHCHNVPEQCWLFVVLFSQSQHCSRLYMIIHIISECSIQY